MHVISLVLSIVITIIYWSLLYNGMNLQKICCPLSLKLFLIKVNESTLDATNVLTHAFNSVCMFIDLWIVAHPLRLLQMFLPVVFGVVYAIFSYIYQSCGGINK